MNKKGVEMSLQTVMIAVLALLVLGVLIYLVITGVIQWGTGTECKDCRPRGQCGSDAIENNAFKCDQEGDVCCTPLNNQNG